MESRLAPCLLVALIASCAPLASETPPATVLEDLSPVASDVAIAFRVHFPEGTPQAESARLVLEASKPGRDEAEGGEGQDAWAAVLRDQERRNPTYHEVDAAPVTDGEVVHLRLPIEAGKTRVRVEGYYLSPFTMPLRGVSPEYGIVEVRPQPASVVRVRVNGVEPGALAGHRFLLNSEPDRPEVGRHPDSLQLEFGGGLEVVLRGVPQGHVLSANWNTTIAMPQRVPGEEVELRYALDAPRHVLDTASQQVWEVGVRKVSTVFGRAVDEEDEPFERVSHQVEGDTWRSNDPQDGVFSRLMVVDQAAGSTLRVRVASRGVADVQVPDPLPWGRVDLGDVVFPAWPPIRGRVVLPDGRPVADFPLAVSKSYPRPSYGGQELTTDAEGAFHFDAVAAEEVILRGWARLDELGQVVDATQDARAYEVRPRRVAAGAEDLELVVTASGFLEGRVEFDDGTAVSSVQLEARIEELPDVETPRGGGKLTASLPVEGGRFRWDRLPPGRWKICASAPAAEEAWATVEVGEAGVVPSFRLVRTFCLTGVVRFPRGGALDDTLVVARGPSESSTRVLTDEEGRFRMERMLAGTYTIWAWRDSARTDQVEVVVGPDGTEPLRLELTYPDGPRLTVQVLDREGRTVPFPSLEVTEPGQGRLPTIHGNAQGKATYGPLAPGRYTVTARISRRDAEVLGYGDEVVESVVVEDGGDILLQLVAD